MRVELNCGVYEIDALKEDNRIFIREVGGSYFKTLAPDKYVSERTGKPPEDYLDSLPLEGHPWTLYTTPRSSHEWMTCKLVLSEGSARKSNYWLGYGPTEDRFAKTEERYRLERSPELYKAALAAARALSAHRYSMMLREVDVTLLSRRDGVSFGVWRTYYGQGHFKYDLTAGAFIEGGDGEVFSDPGFTAELAAHIMAWALS